MVYQSAKPWPALPACRLGGGHGIYLPGSIRHVHRVEVQIRKRQLCIPD